MNVKRMIKSIANALTPRETETSMAKWRLKNKVLRLTGLHLGEHIAISPGFECITGKEDNITIHDYVAIGHNVKFYNFGAIEIGSFTTIAAEVTITNGGHDVENFEPYSGKVTIGKGCWIGHAARIIRPVTIGDNVIIAAGAIVTEDIPAGTVVMGVPAKVSRTRQLPDKVWFLGDIYFNPTTFETVTQEG